MDAIIKVTSTVICGSHLHVYTGSLPQLRPMVMGPIYRNCGGCWERLKNLKTGDRVIVFRHKEEDCVKVVLKA